jgi:peptide/nickel transport system permease protein
VSDSSNRAGEEGVVVATQWRLMWWRFRKHKLALASGIVVLCFYLVALLAGFLATGDPARTRGESFSYLPPQSIHWFDEQGFNPHVRGIVAARDPETFRRLYSTDPQVRYPVRLFVEGEPYRLLGLFPVRTHLFGVEGAPGRTHPFVLGCDQNGRDMWSRLTYATRVSMSIGLVGVLLSLVLGITLGGVSGLYGGWVDTVIQRLIEFLRCIPTIPLWMGLAAALPDSWSVLQRYFAITLILSLIGWTGLARVVRGKFLSLREEDFVTAARLCGCGEMRVIFRHMVPSFLSHIIASTTLAVPMMILSETALSFLGMGIREPAVSWGVLLDKAQEVHTVALYPWLLVPAVPVIVAVLAFNFLGDGLRDAADPYSR